MKTLTYEIGTIDGSRCQVRMHVPRQSQVRDALIRYRELGEQASLESVHPLALDVCASLVDRIDAEDVGDAREWLDTHVPMHVLAALLEQVLMDRIPDAETLGKLMPRRVS